MQGVKNSTRWDSNNIENMQSFVPLLPLGFDSMGVFFILSMTFYANTPKTKLSVNHMHSYAKEFFF